MRPKSRKELQLNARGSVHSLPMALSLTEKKVKVLPAASKAPHDLPPSPPCPHLLYSPPCSLRSVTLASSIFPKHTPGPLHLLFTPGMLFPHRVPSLTPFRCFLRGHIHSKAFNTLSPLNVFPHPLSPGKHCCILCLVHCSSPLLGYKLYASRDFCPLCSLLCHQHLGHHVLHSRC